MPKSFEDLTKFYEDRLRRRERILNMYFKQHKTLTEIAKDLGISRQRVFQVIDAERTKNRK